MPEYELIYLNLGARATPIRLMLTYLGIPFKDSNYDMKNGDWQKIKPILPFEQGPVLVIDKDFKLAQTPAILRYLAKEHGFEPEGSRNQALADMYSNQAQDTIIAIRPWIFSILGISPDRQLLPPCDEKITDAWNNAAVPGFKNTFAKFFERQLKENGTGFLIGNKLCWVDFLAAGISEMIQRVGKTPILDEYQLLKKHWEMIYKNPKIADAVKKERSYTL